MGRQVIDRFISEVPKHLKQIGRVLLMQSTLADVDETVCKLGDDCDKTRTQVCSVLQRSYSNHNKNALSSIATRNWTDTDVGYIRGKKERTFQEL